MKKVIKYSKNIKDILNLKKELFASNKKHLKNAIKINKEYKKLKLRKHCIVCQFSLKNPDFVSHTVPYSICKKCGHLNGIYLMSKKFNEKIYSSNLGKDYSSLYTRNYKSRVEKIYLPKVRFMKKVIKKKIKVLDFGCGNGHFVKACENLKIKAEGIDPNHELIRLGHKYLKKNFIKKLNFEESIDEIITTDANLISFIFVLEHLENPIKIFEAFSKSSAEYIYFSVPMFSFAVFIENCFQNIYPRQLGGPHTNLYSRESINFIIKKFNLNIAGEWWFGTDFYDLYRNILLSSNYRSKLYKKKLDAIFLNQINNLQKILDRSKLCSEVHLILKKNSR
jgi:SAM-dependent methyltransferase